MLHPPRIGPISGVATAPNVAVNLTNTVIQYCTPFPGIGPCEIPPSATGGAACPSDQSQTFGGPTFPIGIMYEVSGVRLVPIVSTLQSNQNGPPYNTLALNPGAGLFAALIIAGWTIAISDTGNEPQNIPNFGSVSLIRDMDQAYQVNQFSPEVVVGHEVIMLPNGSYNRTIVTSIPNRNWCESAIILASDGRLPTIIQSVIVNGPAPVFTLPVAPRLGNLLVAYLGDRTGGAITPPSGSWTSLTQQQCPDAINFGIRTGRLMYKEVCT